MRIVRFDKNGNCQFIYFNWRKFRFETTCWANSLKNLLGRTSGKKHFIIGLWNYEK